jgi:glutathione S-transferase
MDKHLNVQPYLATDFITIADIACYTYVAHAPEGDVDLDDYPNVRAWLSLIEAHSDFVPMRRTPRLSEAS